MRFVFYAAQAGKPWNGQTLYTDSLGGSESAVVYMARALARLGHEVIVFTRDTPGEYDDVVYLPWDSARTVLLTLPCDVLVCSRDFSPLLWQTRTRVKALWSHDVPQGPAPDSADVYFMVSNWLAQIYVGNGFVDPKRVRVSPNGVDLPLFASPGERHYGDGGPGVIPQLVWTSNPERGLWHAGEVLQLVRRTYPRAELHVYGRNAVYGWDSSYEVNFLPDSMEGVILHDSRTKENLAHMLSCADIFLYPTWWPETFCIAALEAQAAGLPVVSNSWGALPETVQGGILLPGRVGVETDLGQMADAVIELLGDGASRQELGQRGRQFAEKLDWSNLAQMWDQMFTSGMGLKA